MLNKENRLKREKDFDIVFKSGKSVFDKVAGLKFQKNGRKNSRFAVVVGLKVSKSAVVRNKARRQYREIIRLNLENIARGYDIIVLTSKESLKLGYEDKEKQLMKVFKKANLLT